MDGLYKKYQVIKTNRMPTDPGAEYFVLRLDSDGCAREAARHYAKCIQRVRPKLAAQLLELVEKLEDAKLETTKKEAKQE